MDEFREAGQKFLIFFIFVFKKIKKSLKVNFKYNILKKNALLRYFTVIFEQEISLFSLCH